MRQGQGNENPQMYNKQVQNVNNKYFKYLES